MAVLPIRTFPDPILREKAKKVRTIDKSILKLIEDMVETMHDAPGAGLAAPQVGVPLRIIVVSVPDQGDYALINPEVVKTKGQRTVVEGCLSIPGYQGTIKRAEQVTVKGKDPSGKEIRVKADELLAQAFEHEIDHTNGILYIDHIEDQSDLKRVRPGDEEEGEGEYEYYEEDDE